jgi:hypothetical protein
LLLLLAPAALAAGPRAPSEDKLQTDLAARWKVQSPDQEVADVVRKSECLPGEAEETTRGRPVKVKTCLVKADVYATRGYRVFIFRDSHLHYAGNRLVSLQLGELEKAWKRGGVPAPAPEQVLALLGGPATERLGPDARLEIVEIGIPRPHREVYRLSVLVRAEFTRDGQLTRLDQLLATLESGGTDWSAVPDLSF